MSRKKLRTIYCDNTYHISLFDPDIYFFTRRWRTSVHHDDRDNKFRWYRSKYFKRRQDRSSFSGRPLCHDTRRFKAFTLESRRRKRLMKFNVIAWTRCARRPDSETFFRRFHEDVCKNVEISIWHNAFHVDSFRFASSRYIRFALSKNRLTGSNPMRRTDISPIGHSFCASSFRAPERPSKSTGGGGGEISRGKSGGKRERETTHLVRVQLRWSARPMFLVPVKALHVSIPSQIIAFQYSRSNFIISLTRIYIHISIVCDNDVMTTIRIFILLNPRIKVSIFRLIKKNNIFLAKFLSLFNSSCNLCVTNWISS